MHVAQFDRRDLDGAMALFAAERWLSYLKDEERTFRALTAAGSTTMVAIEGDEVIGLIQLLGDGEIQAHVSTMVVAREHRRRGIGQELLREALRRAGCERIDLVSVADRFYDSITNRTFTGYRITRQDLGLGR